MDLMTATKHHCPRREELGLGQNHPFKVPEHDYIRPNNTCSWCGSLMPDQFMELVSSGQQVSLVPTDKNYKVYLEQPGESTKKFYFQHLNPAQQAEFIRLYNERKLTIRGGGFYVMPFFCQPG